MNARVNEQIFWQWRIYIIGFLCVFFLIPYHFASASLTDGLVGHWTFDGKNVDWASTTAEVRDISTSRNHGNASTSMSSNALVKGKIGQGMYFDGVNDYIRTVNNPLNATEPNGFSVSLWFMKATTTGVQYIVEFGGSGAFALMDDQASAGLQGLIRDSTYHWTTARRIPRDVWYHVVLSYNPYTDILMEVLNGEVVHNATTSFSGTFINPNPLFIGGRTYGTGMFKGKIDDVRVYNRALSATEIQQLYKLGGGKTGVTQTRNVTASTSPLCTGISCGLVGHWTFDGKDTTWTSATAGTVRDVSGNGNTGTLTNMNRATSSKSGKIGQAFMFSNASVIETASSNILGTTASMSFTISGWFNVASSSINQMYIAEYGGGGAFSVEKVASSDTMRCKLRDPSAGFLYSNSVTRPQIGQWHLFSCIYNASNKTLVFDIDGSNNTPVSVSAFSTYDNPGKLFFGNRSYGTHPFMGSLDNIRVYNRALSATEIQQLYKLGGGKTGVTQTRNVTASTSPLCTGISCGLVGHWTFDGKNVDWASTTAEVRDSSGNRNNGNTTNMTASNATAGKVGQGMRFSSTSATYVSVNHNTSLDIDNTESLTVSLWFKSSGVDGVNRRNLFGKSSTTQNIGYGCFQEGGSLYIACRLRNSTIPESSTQTYQANKWYHFIYRIDGEGVGTGSVYLNGVSQSSISLSDVDASNSGYFGIGTGAPISGTTWDGGIDDVRIYNRALSATEVEKLYKIGQTKMR